MKPLHPFARSHALMVLVWGLGLAMAPWGFDGGPDPLAPPAAWAHDHGPGDGGDDKDDDPGRAGEDDEDDEDDDQDGGSRDDETDPEDDRSGRRGRPDDSASNPPTDGHAIPDITVQYPDGWTERIVGGRYELIDYYRQLVVARAATPDDYARMAALR